MSLSRPVEFPLLKLPFLCIECVIQNCDSLDTIFFALISKRTRGIVRHVKPLNRIRIFLSETKWISFDRKREVPLVLQNNPLPLYTTKTNFGLESYTDGNEFHALKMGMKFLNEIFKCQVERVEVNGDNFPISGDIGVKSTVNLCIDHDIVYAQSRKLNLLLENLEVTGTCIFHMRDTENGFYCDPKLFKCRKLLLSSNPTTWFTDEFLMQLEVSQLNFDDCLFSVEAIVLFVTRWFHSDNRKFEYLYIDAHNRQFPLESFQTDVLNPIPFNGRTRTSLSESFGDIDISAGLELRRNDDLVATIHANNGLFLFYVWHE